MNLTSLPFDILLEILVYLPFKDLLKMSNTNKFFREFIKNFEWSVVFKVKNISRDLIKQILIKIRVASIYFENINIDDIVYSLNFIENCKSIAFTNFNPQPQHLRPLLDISVFEKLSNIENIEILGFNINEHGLKLLKKCRKIKFARMDYKHFTNSLITLDLESIYFTDCSFIYNNEINNFKIPTLKLLSINYSDGLFQNELKNLFQNNPQLEHIMLNEVITSPDTFDDLCKLSCLKTLEVSGRGINDHAIKYINNLKSLKNLYKVVMRNTSIYYTNNIDLDTRYFIHDF